jgi:nucleoid DNA-binding protein
MDDDFLQAFGEVVREQIAHQCDVELDGIGTFRLQHQKQYQQQYQDGRVVMMPPKDTVEFEADSNWENDH